MRKIFMLLALVLCLGCTAVPVFAADGVGRDDVTSATPAPDAETDDFSGLGNELSGSVTDSADDLNGVLDDVQANGDSFIDGFGNVSGFFGLTIGGLLGIMPPVVSWLLVFSCLAVVVVAIINVLRE